MCTLLALYHEWESHPEWWFTATHETDNEINYKYASCMQSMLTDKELGLLGEEALIGYILAHDQVPRHVLRNTVSRHVILYHTQIALNAALLLLERGTSLTTYQWCFTMLPLRHTQDQNLIFYVMSMAWDRYSMHLHTDNESLMRKFMKATYQRCPVEDQSEQVIAVMHCGGPCHMVLDDFHAILAHSPTSKEVVEWDASPLKKMLGNLGLFKTRNHPVILSISGGVDSMLASYVLCKVYGYTSVHAVHINYKNKATCDQDEKFVKLWCQSLGIPLYIRRIHEVQRAICMEHELRDMYESYTRDVRYNTYKTVWRMLSGAEGTPPWVVLGHNKNDCFENILTNICKTQKYEQLCGMDKVITHDNIIFWRPLLDIEKSTIRSWAKKLGIPHLHDSTPSWSQRGKIRDIVVPVLKEWDERFLPGMFELAETVSSFYQILGNTVDSWLERTIELGGNVIAIEFYSHDYKAVTNKLVWKQFIVEVSGNRVSNKSLETFIHRLQAFLDNYDDANMRCIMTSVLSKNCSITIGWKGEVLVARLQMNDNCCEVI